MMLLPPAPGLCHLCAVAHGEREAHDWTSPYYGVRFQSAHGRSPTRADAIAHLDADRRAGWVRAMQEMKQWSDDNQKRLDAGDVIAEPTLYSSEQV